MDGIRRVIIRVSEPPRGYFHRAARGEKITVDRSMMRMYDTSILMARKRAPDLKTFVIQARVNQKERKLFQELADSEHKTVGQLIRECLYSRLEEKQKAVA